MYKNRIDKLKIEMSKNNIEGVLLFGDANRNYFSGFTGEESYSLIMNDSNYFFTDSRYIEQANIEVKDYINIEYKGDFIEYICNFIKEHKIKKLGVEENILTLSIYKAITGKIDVELYPIENIISEIRIIKDKKEIETIKHAASLADKAFEHILNYIKAGVSEKDIALELEFYLKKIGASDLSFKTIAASGERSSLPHGAATEKIVKAGEFLTLDFGCIYNNYCSDMTRTVAVSSISEKMIEVYNIVLTAQERALKEIKPDIKASYLDSIARDYIKEKGYGDYFGHGLGHGVGREIHEEPRISPKGDKILKSGMIITDEPGIYLNGKFGVRIEDLILVTDDGYEVLSKSPKDLIYV
ncbi:MAG: M24 family metallopeptidase [Clostridiaceae bacterium]